MGKYKVTKKSDKPKNGKGSNSRDCACKLYLDSRSVECEKCGMWWHIGCANLKNLSEDALNDLEEWLCPKCFVSPYVTRDFSPENCAQMVKLMKDELVAVIPAITADVTTVLEESTIFAKSSDIEGTVKDAVDQSIKLNMDEQSEKLETAVKVAAKTELEKPKWSGLLKTNMDKFAEETKQTVEKSMENAVKKNEGELLQNTVDKTRAIQERNMLDRGRRNRNITIKNLPESKKVRGSEKIADDRETVVKLLERYSVTPNEILRVVRAGIENSNQPRIVIVTLATPALAQDLHEYGHGRRVRIMEKNLVKEEYWINEDLIQADRTANYNARKFKREKDAERAAKRKSADDDVATQADSEIPPLIHRSSAPIVNNPVRAEPEVEKEEEIVPSPADKDTSEETPFQS